MEKSESVANLIQFVVDSVRQAHADDAPFHHLQFDHLRFDVIGQMRSNCK